MVREVQKVSDPWSRVQYKIPIDLIDICRCVWSDWIYNDKKVFFFL